LIFQLYLIIPILTYSTECFAFAVDIE
jgi:hypothetical protein